MTCRHGLSAHVDKASHSQVAREVNSTSQLVDLFTLPTHKTIPQVVVLRSADMLSYADGVAVAEFG